MKKLITYSIFVLCMIFSAISAQAQTYWNGTADTEFAGSGTEADPYLITTAEELAGLAARVNNKEQKEDFAGQYFKLTNDLYLTDFTNTDTASWLEWKPIGMWTDEQMGPYEHYFDTCYFRGHFDGDGHTIYNAYMGTVGDISIDNPDDPWAEDVIDLTGSCMGFFGFVDSATIKNLTLQNAGITASNYYSGILISNATNVLIENCHVKKSSLVATIGSSIGGLIGHLSKNSVVDSCSAEEINLQGSYVGGLATYIDSASVVRNSHVTGLIKIMRRHSGNYGGDGGGLVQLNDGVIENCYADVEILLAGIADYAGGFVAKNGGVIRNSYAMGDVRCGENCAGFVARNLGLIESCYSTGNVILPSTFAHSPASFASQVGLFSTYMGYVEADMPGTCINCFGAGSCISTETGTSEYITYGFLYSLAENDSRIVNCSFNKDSVVLLLDLTMKLSGGARGYTTAYMQSQAFVDKLNMFAALHGISTWEYRAGQYPVPTGVKATNITDYLAGGSGTEEDPYLISTKQQLENFRDYVNLGETFSGKYIRQTADIALNAPRSKWGVQAPTPWTPIGDLSFSQFHATIILDLFNWERCYHFGGTYDGDSHKIENMYIDDPQGRPAGFFGTLYHDATIKNLSVTDAYVVSPGTLGDVGILAGEAPAEEHNVYISQCHTSGIVGDPDNIFGLYSASAIIGGIRGCNSRILNCSSSADVYAVGRASAVTRQPVIGGIDTIGNFLFTGTLTKRGITSDCYVMVPNAQDSWVVSENGYFDSDKVKPYNDATNYNNLGRSTAYLQSAEFVNILNAYVDDWNATHTYKLDYWEVQENGYPKVNPNYKPSLVVTFESNGGSAVAAKKVGVNTHVLMPEKPTKEGYIFAGWYADAAFTQVFDFDSTAVTQSMTLYAKWLEPTYDEYDYSIFNNKFATEFHITNKAQFIGFMHAVNGIDGVLTPNNFKGKTVYLDCDILLNDTADWQYWGKYTYAESWTPIGTGSSSMDPVHPFLGIFDGQGHVISGLYIDAEENFKAIANHYQDGLFGFVGTKGEATEIRNLGVQASVVDKRGDTPTDVGLLVGVLRDGTISQCFTHGKIIVNAKSNEDIGGFAGQLGGFNYDAGGAITDCYARVDIIYNPMDINAINRGVFGSGLVDWNNGSISNSYVAGGSWQEGVAGGTISNVYFNKELSPNTGANTGAGMTTPEMHSKTTFAGFDFDSIWGRNDTINGGYPYLRCFHKEFIPDSPDGMKIVTDIELLEADSTITVVAGDKVQLHASVLPIDATEQGITWSLTGSGNASIDENGLVMTWHKSAYGSHTTTEYVTATTVQGGYKKKCTIKVFHPYFQIYTNERSRRIGSSEWIEDYGYMKSVNWEYPILFWTQQDREGLMRDISFTNSNPEVASFEIVSQDTLDHKNRRGALGILKCHSVGNTTLTLIHPSGYTATLKYTVTHYPITGLDISTPSTTLKFGDTLQLQYTSTPVYASEPPKGLSWSSSDENILKVDANGQVLAVGVGTATVTLTSTTPALTATKQITVEHVELSRIEIISSTGEDNNTILEGDTCTLSVVYYPANTTMRGVEWLLDSSEDSVYVKLIPMGDSCKIVGLKEAGRRRIYISAKTINDPWGRYAGYSLYVNKKVAVTGIQLTKSEYALLKGDVDKTLVANLSPSNASNKNVIWSSADTTIVSVRTEEGHSDIAYLSALRVGKTTITATTQDGGFSASCVVTVTSNTFFTVTFLNEDGTTLQTTQVREGEMPKYTGTAPTKTASAEYVYTFAGWSPEFVIATADATYTATYTESKRKYTIQFLNYNGSLLQSSQVEYGVMPEYTGATPVRPSNAQYNYMFDAWTPEITIVTKDANYTATFTSFIRQYKVTFLDWDGTQLSEQVVDYGGAAVAPTAPTRDGYTFIGWDKDFSNIKSDLIVTAQYKQNIVYYTVTFLDWDGSELHVEQVEEGKNAVGPTTNPTREGYTFIGWSKPITNITSNLTVIAQYEQNKIYYTVTFLDWDGTELYVEQVEEGKDAVGPTSNPIREGYIFIGWSKPITNITSNLTVIAQYEKEQGTALDDIEEDATLRPRKEMIDGILYIIMPDGTKYTMQGKRVK